MAAQANSTFFWNENKTGCSVGEHAYTKTCSDNFITQNSSHAEYQLHISDNTVPCNTLQNVNDLADPLEDVGTTLQQQLADQNNYFSGNKNKTWFFDGDFTGANIMEGLSYGSNLENCGDVIDVMDTVILDQDLYQNCSLNSSNESGQVQKLTCDTVHTNEIHTDVFGFMPKGPLKVYDGNPDIIRAHLMIKDSGTPNYIGCRIPVVSNLKCQKWSQYLQNYWESNYLTYYSLDSLLILIIHLN